MKDAATNARRARMDAYKRLITPSSTTPPGTAVQEEKTKRQPTRRMVKPTEITVKVVAA